MPLLGHVGVLLASPLTGAPQVGLELALTVFINVKTSNAQALLIPEDSIGSIWAALFPSPEVNPPGNVPVRPQKPGDVFETLSLSPPKTFLSLGLQTGG